MIQAYWSRVVAQLDIIGSVVWLDPLPLGLACKHITDKYKKMAFAARKNLPRSWISDEPPSNQR